MLRCSGMLGLLRCDREANAKQPQRENERTPGHARSQNQIAANASEILRKHRLQVEELRVHVIPSEVEAATQQTKSARPGFQSRSITFS